MRANAHSGQVRHQPIRPPCCLQKGRPLQSLWCQRHRDLQPTLPLPLPPLLRRCVAFPASRPPAAAAAAGAPPRCFPRRLGAPQMSSSRVKHARGCRWAARSGWGERRRRRRRSRRPLLDRRWRAAAAATSSRGGSGSRWPPLLQARGGEEGGRELCGRAGNNRGFGAPASLQQLFTSSSSAPGAPRRPERRPKTFNTAWLSLRPPRGCW